MQYVVLGKMGDRFFWQYCGRESPRLEASHPAFQEVYGTRRLPREIEENRVRKAMRELLDWKRREAQELEESRARSRSSAWRRPGATARHGLLTCLMARVYSTLVLKIKLFSPHLLILLLHCYLS